MRIFDETKTYQLNSENLDFEKGYLKPDKLIIKHHDKVEAQEAQYNRRVEELPNGSIQVWQDLVTPAMEAKEAYDDYEDIEIYIPYTAEELKYMLRNKRASLLNAFDKWEKAVLRGREEDKQYVMNWYYDLLDLKELAFTNIPERIKYYL